MTSRSTIVRPRPDAVRLLAVLGLLSLWSSGCGETEQISRYAVPKEQPATPASDAGPFDVSQRPAMAWFFKLTGPAEAVAAQRDNFQSLVASTTITGEEASWSLPDGWSQQPASQMRYATLTVDESDPPLEVSVSKLPLFAARDDYLRQNINRWRGQLGLAPLAGDDWLEQATADGEIERQASGGQDITFVDINSQMDDLSEARMLAAIILPPESAAAAKPTVQPAKPATPPSTAGQPLTYEKPDEWQPGKTSMMRVAAFEVTDGDNEAEITVIPAGGDLLSNVNRWRGQIGLEPWTDAQLKESAEELTVNGMPATYVDLQGSQQTILAVVLPNGSQSWFFKLTGDPELAEREAERFKAFVESVKLK